MHRVLFITIQVTELIFPGKLNYIGQVNFFMQNNDSEYTPDWRSRAQLALFLSPFFRLFYYSTIVIICQISDKKPTTKLTVKTQMKPSLTRQLLQSYTEKSKNYPRNSCGFFFIHFTLNGYFLKLEELVHKQRFLTHSVPLEYKILLKT